jgi:hypothetical protein
LSLRKTHDNKGVPAYTVGASSQATNDTVPKNALKNTGMTGVGQP